MKKNVILLLFHASHLRRERKAQLHGPPHGARLPHHEPYRAGHDHRRFLRAVGAEFGYQEAGPHVPQGARPINVAMVASTAREHLFDAATIQE